MQAFSQFDFSSFQMTPVCVKLKKTKQNKRPAQAIYLRPHYIVQISLNLIWPRTDLDAPQLCVTSLLSHVPQEQLLRATGSEDSEFHRKTGKSSRVRSTESTKVFTQSTWPCKRQIGVCYVWPQWQDLLIFEENPEMSWHFCSIVPVKMSSGTRPVRAEPPTAWFCVEPRCLVAII